VQLVLDEGGLYGTSDARVPASRWELNSAVGKRERKENRVTIRMLKKAINIFYIPHATNQITPCVNPDVDIPSAKLDSIFTREPPKINAFWFYVLLSIE